MKKRTAWLLLLMLSLLAVGIFGLWRTKQHADRINAALSALARHQDDHEEKERALSRLAVLCEIPYPEMARAFVGTDSKFETFYRALRTKLPANIKSHFPSLPDKAELRRALVSNLFDLGPSGSRAMIGVVQHGFRPSPRYENVQLLRSLYWSIPESPKAVLILSNYLAQPKRGAQLFGMLDAREIWPHVGQFASLMINWLAYPDSASEAAEALGLMGTNAHFAIPILINLAENGFVGEPKPMTLQMFSDGRIIPDIPVRNRVAAIEALATLGIATDEVLKLLRANWTNDAPRIREVTAYAVGNLAFKSVSLLDFFIAHLDRKNDRVLQHQLDALAKMGTNAQAAVPALLDLSFSLQSSVFSLTTKTPVSAPIGYRRTLLWSNETQPGMMAATFALAEIDPATAAARRLELIAVGLRSLAPSNTVVRLRPYSRELISIAEPGLREGREIERILLAHHILLLDPHHAAARAFLETQMNAESLTRRAVAASWLYHATHERDKTLAVLSAASLTLTLGTIRFLLLSCENSVPMLSH